eukprot:6472756-Amphidinium_carterae.1
MGKLGRHQQPQSYYLRSRKTKKTRRQGTNVKLSKHAEPSSRFVSRASATSPACSFAISCWVAAYLQACFPAALKPPRAATSARPCLFACMPSNGLLEQNGCSQILKARSARPPGNGAGRPHVP